MQSMRISKLNEEKLQETEYKNYLNEVVDLCLYGRCLNEETANKYFEFLITDGLKKVDLNNQEAEKLNDSIDKVNMDRFNKELDSLSNDESKYNCEGYFEGKTFAKFRKDFKKLLIDKKNDKSLTRKEIENILYVFDLYCSRFVKNNDAPRKTNEYINPTFRDKAHWIDMQKDKSINRMYL